MDAGICEHERRGSVLRGPGCAWTGNVGEIGRSARVPVSWVSSASEDWLMVQRICSDASTGERASSHQGDYRSVFLRGKRDEKEQRYTVGWVAERRCRRM